MNEKSFTKITQSLCDTLFATIPRRLRTTKDVNIVAHRGAFGPGKRENQLPAFRSCKEAGVWGIELDVHWTQDGIPVVHHDSHCGRVFNRSDIKISEITASKLKAQIPQIPLLKEVISEFEKYCTL